MEMKTGARKNSLYKRVISRSVNYIHDRHYPWIFLILFLLAWELLIRYLNVPGYVIPAPTSVVMEGIEIWDVLANHLLTTLKEVILGFLLGTAVGVFIAFSIAYYSIIRKIFLPYIVMLQTMPKLGLAPLYILWFGFGLLTDVIIITSISFFPVLINFLAGLDEFNENEMRLMSSYNASKNQIFFHVRLFRALPFLYSGLQLGMILSVTGAIVAEFVVGDAGLGYLTLLANNTLETSMMFCALILLGLLGFFLYYIMTLFKKILMPWSAKTETLTSRESAL
jgi:NitT/TauT family transport system permease protein